jgi:probable rRNA maturation factor
MSAAGVSISVANRQRRVKVTAAEIRSAALAAADHSGRLSGLVSVVVVGERKMRELNLEFARVDGTTDVLAFDLADGETPLEDGPVGEVIVNASLAAAEAAARGKKAVDELLLYVVHGVLHLGGYRDKTEAQQRAMQEAERAVLGRLRRPGR